jgi:hypothetical protein
MVADLPRIANPEMKWEIEKSTGIFVLRLVAPTTQASLGSNKGHERSSGAQV